MAVLSLLLAPGVVVAALDDQLWTQQWSFTDTHVAEAWAATDAIRSAEPVIVAVIDNGFDSFHEELSPAVWHNSREIADNRIDDDRNGYVDDVDGWNFSGGNNDPRPSVLDATAKDENDKTYLSIHHGTLVAGLINAVANHPGSSHRAQLMNLKVVESIGSGSSAPVGAAIRYAVDNGADVINMSLVGSADDDIKQAVQYAREHEVAVIAAAGNDRVDLGRRPSYPVCADAGESERWVLGVSAIDEAHYLAKFSNFGSSCVDLTAPGTKIASTMRYAPAYGLSDFFGGRWSGTSFAAPFVSGTAALIKAVQPEWKAPQIYEAVLSSAHMTPPDDLPSYRNVYGAGLLQTDKAIRYALDRRSPELDIPIPEEPSNTPAIRFQVLVVAAAGAPQTVRVVGEATPAIISPESSIGPVRGVATYVHDGERRWVNISRAPRGRWQIKILRSDGTVVSSWAANAPATNPKAGWQAVVGDVTGDEAIEIVLAPTGSSTELFRVFDERGRQLKVVTAGRTAVRSALSLAKKWAGDKDRIAVLYEEKKIAIVRQFDSSFVPRERIILIGARFSPVFAVARLTEAGRHMYVLGGAAGNDPALSYFSSAGELERRFFAYDGSARSGLLLTAARDAVTGLDDVVVGVARGDQPLRVWNGRVQKLDEWWPLTEGTPLGRLIAVEGRS